MQTYGHSWENSLNVNYQTLVPLKYGWEVKDDLLQSLWYVGSALPNDQEL